MRRNWEKGRSRLFLSIFVSICIWVNRSNIKNSLGKIWCPVDVQFRCQCPWRVCGSRQRGPLEGLSAHQLLVLGLHSLCWQKSIVDLNPQSTSVSKASVSPIPAIIVPGSEKREFTAQQSTIFHLRGQKKYFLEKKKTAFLETNSNCHHILRYFLIPFYLDRNTPIYTSTETCSASNLCLI